MQLRSWLIACSSTLIVSPVPALAALLLLSASALAAESVPDSAAAPAPGSDAQAIRQQLEQEQARIHALEQRLAADEAAQASAAGATDVASANANALLGTFGPSGYTLQSADGVNAIHFRGNLSVDGRYYSDAYTPATDDTWLVRKLRPTLEGTVEDIYDFRFMPDFGQGKTILQDAWADARVKPWLVFEFGKFKAPVGLERLQLEQYQRFIEASLPSDLLPYRDLGLQIGGSLDGRIVSYDVGMFDGALDGGSTDANSVPDQDSTGKFTWQGRVFVQPFLHIDAAALQRLGFGVAETYVKDSGVATTSTTTNLLASYKTPGQQSMFSYRSNTVTSGAYNNATVANGLERRLVPQLYYYYRSVGLLGEYVREDQQVSRNVAALATRYATLQNNAWQLQAAWFLTGEDEGYDTGSTPRRSFGGHGGAGAWELVVRYHEIHFDNQGFIDGINSFVNPASAPAAAHAIGTGVNWYLTGNFKVQLDYEITRFNGGAVVGNRPAEHVLTSQFALIF